jgi:Histone H1-like protein Hc1.
MFNELNYSVMKDLVKRIKEEYELFAVNAEAQVEKGNKAAGARARKAALALMKDFKEFRKVSVEEAK